MFLKPNCNNQKSGFSLIEVLLSVAIVSLLVFAAIPLIMPAYYRHQLSESVGRTQGFLRTAHRYAQAGYYDNAWGVFYETDTVPNKIYIFRGSDFQQRDQSFDEIYSLNNSISIEGFPEEGIVFGRGTGQTDGHQIIFQSTVLDDRFIITIAHTGLVDSGRE